MESCLYLQNSIKVKIYLVIDQHYMKVWQVVLIPWSKDYTVIIPSNVKKVLNILISFALTPPLLPFDDFNNYISILEIAGRTVFIFSVKIKTKWKVTIYFNQNEIPTSLSCLKPCCCEK